MLTRHFGKQEWQRDFVMPQKTNPKVALNLEVLQHDEYTTLYGKRWSVEPYHESLTQNVVPSLSPTKTATTQSKHLFASLSADIKLEMLKVSAHSNHFGLKSNLYVRVLRAALAAYPLGCIS